MKIKTADTLFDVELRDTPTTCALTEQLPVSGKAILWGKEIYFSIPIESDLEIDARDILENGEIAYYPPMNAFCIFFGPTPVSLDDRPRAADKVNVIGKIKGDYSLLESVQNGEFIELVQ